MFIRINRYGHKIYAEKTGPIVLHNQYGPAILYLDQYKQYWLYHNKIDIGFLISKKKKNKGY